MHNVRRQKEAFRVRENRIIAGYVQFKHPGIYNEAKAFYTKLSNLYPEKKDLRKTYEYQTFTTGLESTKYKYSRRSRRQHQEITDNMILQIQLMDKSAVPPTVPPAVPPAVPAVVPPAVSAIPPIDVIIEDAEITLPAVSDDIIDEIIEGLRQDPDISTIFDHIDIEDERNIEDELLLW